MKKNIFIATVSILLLVTTIAASLPNRVEPPKFKNLKVLPKNISEAALDKIMDDFNAALGVSCDFCHTKNEKTNDLVFELDKKSEKLIARKMMIMTNDINKKYFAAKAVSCITCHRQKPYPEVDSVTAIK
jgi:Photosynthetic reaction centre cytochrome C subunit